MTTIYAATSDQVLVATRLTRVGCNNQNTVKLHVEFDSPWNGYTKSAVFHTSKDPKPYEVILSSDGNCLIPAEVLAEEAILYIGVKGVKTASSEIKASTPIKYKVLAGTPSVVISDPAPNVYQQLLSAYNVERARMDNLLANSGAASDDEVIDLRIGINGETYDLAGDAVRAQIGIVSNDQRIASEAGRATFAPYAGWQIGGMMSAQPTAHRNRIVSQNILYFTRRIKVKIDAGFRIGVHTVTSDGTFVADSNWRQDEYEIPTHTHFKIVVARVTEDSSEIANIAEFSAAVTFETFASHEISNMSAMIEQHSNLFDLIAKRKTIEPVGSYYTTGGSGLPNNRIHASDLACDSLAVVTFLDPTKEYFYGVDLYTNDGRRAQIATSGWMRTSERPFFVVSQNCVMDISISKIDATSFDDLSEMDGLFAVSMYSKISDAKENVGGRKKCWLTSAHQGFVDSVLRPNSLAAYYNAYLNGADMIETDAWRASDGVFIVNHDPTVTGKNANGETVTYTISETTSSDICSLILSSDEKWGVQKVPTLEQVLNLAYHTGLIVNIDLKNGYTAAEPVAKMVLASGMQGKVIYALNGSGMAGINTILAIDPDARFIDGVGFVSAVANYPERGKRCFAYTSDMSDETVNAIREGGCMLALISLTASNFETAISYHPDMCEYLHISDFRSIEGDYFKNAKLY